MTGFLGTEDMLTKYRYFQKQAWRNDKRFMDLSELVYSQQTNTPNSLLECTNGFLLEYFSSLIVLFSIRNFTNCDSAFKYLEQVNGQIQLMCDVLQLIFLIRRLHNLSDFILFVLCSSPLLFHLLMLTFLRLIYVIY